VYGEPTQMPIREDAPLDPISPYGVSKLAGERYAAVFAKLYGLRVTSLRLFSVYGPRQRKQVVYDILTKLRANPKQIEVLGDGSQTRDFTFVTDVVQALLLVGEKAPAQGEAYNVATGKPYTIAELVQAWAVELGVSPKINFSGSVRPGDPERWEVDISKLRGLGYEPRTELPDGLRRIREWYDAESVG
jgi:UDP-glucose 4-epimerase